MNMFMNFIELIGLFVYEYIQTYQIQQIKYAQIFVYHYASRKRYRLKV